MQAEARYTLVGAVVLAVLAALIGAGIWLAGGADRSAYRNFTVYFKEQSMDGLALGSAVKMRGINVGSVSAYHFVDPGANSAARANDGDVVRVTLRLDAEVPVREAAEAYVKRSLVTGLASIEITNGNGASPRLVNAPPGERYPVIAEGSSDIDKVANAVSKLAENGAQVIERMNSLLSDENRTAFAGTLANLDTLSTHLVDNKASLDAAVQGIRDASDEFRFAGASIAQAATRADDSITALGQRADDALKETTQAMVGLQRETRLISQEIQALSEAGSLELVQTSRDVRASADALGSAGQKLANPRSLIFAPQPAELGPGESLP